MGCSASKAANEAAVTGRAVPSPSSSHRNGKALTPKEQQQLQQQQSSGAHSPATATSHHSAGSHRSGSAGKAPPTTAGTVASSRQRRPQRSSKQEAVATASVAGTTAGSRASKSRRKSSKDAEQSSVYKLLAKVQQQKQQPSNAADAAGASIIHAADSTLTEEVQNRILQACENTPSVAAYQNPTTKSTPLHMAVRLLDHPQQEVAATAQEAASSSSSWTASLPTILQGLIRANPDAVRVTDAAGHIPLHYALAPTTGEAAALPLQDWKVRAEVLQLLLAADIDTSMEYLQKTDVHFEHATLEDDAGATVESTICTPFYRAIQALPDDFDRESPTVVFCAVLKEACPAMVQVPNAHDGDTPLALLYRRFTRQFDLAEKFFAGDNSRPEVVEHRKRYKTAAGNTWKIIECLLRPEVPENTPENYPLQWRLLHRAVQLETPPDLLRYIVETNAEDLQQVDQGGNLPLHYAAQTVMPQIYYSKFVTDELLYKYPESASVPNGEGKLALHLAILAKKPWIAGGLQSLYDAYPAAMEQVDVSRHEHLRKVFSEDGSPPSPATPHSPEEKKTEPSVRDEPHDAIMLVQQTTTPVQHVVNAMWAHEEDAGIQMLACVALARQVRQAKASKQESPAALLLRIALPAVSAVVNAMKAHPNEVIVQEKASHVLQLLAPVDGQRELSFVASGAVAALVGALQAHVSDASVQEEAAAALAAIVQAGGAERATIVASVSGLTALVNSLAAHPDSVGVQREACRALAYILPFGESANLPSLCRSQTEPLLQSAASQFPVECAPLVEQILPHL